MRLDELPLHQEVHLVHHVALLAQQLLGQIDDALHHRAHLHRAATAEETEQVEHGPPSAQGGGWWWWRRRVAGP